MNPAALHLDAEYAKGTPFGERIVNSVFTLGLLVGLSVYDTTYGTTIGNLGWEEVRFPRPVLIGDTLRASSTVHSKRESKSRHRLRASWCSSTSPGTSATSRSPPAAARRSCCASPPRERGARCRRARGCSCPGTASASRPRRSAGTPMP